MSKDIYPRNPVEQIEEFRGMNNRLWMMILRIALQHAPKQTKEVLRSINRNDRHISMLLEGLADDKS